MKRTFGEDFVDWPEAEFVAGRYRAWTVRDARIAARHGHPGVRCENLPERPVFQLFPALWGPHQVDTVGRFVRDVVMAHRPMNIYSFGADPRDHEQMQQWFNRVRDADRRGILTLGFLDGAGILHRVNIREVILPGIEQFEEWMAECMDGEWVPNMSQEINVPGVGPVNATLYSFYEENRRDHFDRLAHPEQYE